MPFRMPPMPFPMPPLFDTAAKDISAINTFEKLLNILFSEGYWLTLRLYNTIVFCNYNWYVSIWIIKFVSPLTTRISVFTSFPARRPWCSNSQLSRLILDPNVSYDVIEKYGGFALLCIFSPHFVIISRAT